MGVPFGLVLGGGLGMLLGLVTVVFFFPRVQPLRYRLIAMLLCVPLSTILTYRWLSSEFNSPIGDNTYLIFLTGLGVVASLYVSQRIADWYLAFPR
jgi:ABC-type transport system involved in cytochrome c biogenesis permease subunit